MKLNKNIIILIFLIAILAGALTACNESSINIGQTAITEKSFADDDSLMADPESHTVLTFLEHPDSTDLGSDTGTSGVDIIPYRYTKTLNHTFCWEDDDIEASHYMSITDHDGNNLLTLAPNRKCQSVIIQSGDYLLHIFHDGKDERAHPVFIIPGGDDLSPRNARHGELSVRYFHDLPRRLLGLFARDAVADVVQNAKTLLTNRKCVGCDLSGADLSSLSLPGADLAGANLSGANLSHSDFSVSNFTSANLQNADMSYSNFAGAVFDKAQLDGAEPGPSSLFLFATWTKDNCICEPDIFTRDNKEIGETGSFQPIPAAIALSSSQLGSGAWIANYDSDSISILETSTLTFVQSISVGRRPSSLAISPNGMHVYVGRDDDDAGTRGGLAVVDTEGEGEYGELLEAVGLTVTPVAIAVSADSSKIFVAHANQGLAVLDTQGETSIDKIVVSLKLIANVKLGYMPSSMTISPDGSTIYIATSGNKVIIVSAESYDVIDEISLAGDPASIAISPDGKTIYVAQDDGTVSAADTKTRTVIASIVVGNDPKSIDVSYDGTLIYVANSGDDNVSVISSYNNDIIGNIPVGRAPVSLALSPEPSDPLCYPFCAYVGNSGDRTISVVSPPQFNSGNFCSWGGASCR